MKTKIIWLVLLWGLGSCKPVNRERGDLYGKDVAPTIDPDGEKTQADCNAKNMDFDSSKKICIMPNMAFCAAKGMVKSLGGSCGEPASKADCDKLGMALGKTYTFKNGRCDSSSTIVDGGNYLDPSIQISWIPSSTVFTAGAVAFANAGTVQVKPASNYLQLSVLGEASHAICDVRGRETGAKTLFLEVKGKQSGMCKGAFLVVNRETLKHNKQEFSIKIN